MKTTIAVEVYGIINDIERIVKDFNSFQLVDNSQDVKAIKEYFGNSKKLADFDGFFVKVDNGDYSEVYGFEGFVPYTYKNFYKIERIIK